jgi:hypothetical protein
MKSKLDRNEMKPLERFATADLPRPFRAETPTGGIVPRLGDGVQDPL